MKTITLLFLSATLLGTLAARNEVTPGFFLKITKNIPRLGRSPPVPTSVSENYIFKASSSSPKIGRSEPIIDPRRSNENPQFWYNRIQMPSKKMSDSLSLDQTDAYNLVQPLDANTIYDVLSRDMLDSRQFRFVAWKDFDRALEEDAELYGKLLAIGKEANLNFPGDSNKFVSLYGDASNNDLLYYRADRDIGTQGEIGWK